MLTVFSVTFMFEKNENKQKTYQPRCRYLHQTQGDQIWQNFANLAKVNKSFANFWLFISCLAKCLLWKICDIIVLIGIVLNSQILKNNLTIWSHWSNNNNNNNNRWIIIHFRREKGFCRLCYYAAEKTDFQISGEKYFELFWLSSVNTKASRPYPYMEEGRILYVSVHLCVCPSMLQKTLHILWTDGPIWENFQGLLCRLVVTYLYLGTNLPNPHCQKII